MKELLNELDACPDAKRLTDEFQEKYKNHEWDGDFYDTIDEFLNEKLNQNKAKRQCQNCKEFTVENGLFICKTCGCKSKTLHP